MVTDDQLAEVERRILLSLRRTGVNFIFVWPVAIGVVWAAATYQHLWMLVIASALLGILFFAVCIPNIGRTAALNKMYGRMLVAFRRHVVLADVGALLVLYAIAALWWSLPLPTPAAALAGGIALINSLLGSDA